MSRHGAIELPWGDGEQSFRLGLGEIEELERKCDLSLFELKDRLARGDRRARVGYITEVIRIALIGGGKSPMDALALVRRYVDERPLDESCDVAYMVTLAGLSRLHPSEQADDSDGDDPSGEADAAESDGLTSPQSEAPQS